MQDQGTTKALFADNMYAHVHFRQKLPCAPPSHHLRASNLSCGHTEMVSVRCMKLALLHAVRQQAVPSLAARARCTSRRRCSTHMQEGQTEQARLLSLGLLPTIMSVLRNFLQQFLNACQLRNLLRVLPLSHLPRLAAMLWRVFHLSQDILFSASYQASARAQALVAQAPWHDC